MEKIKLYSRKQEHLNNKLFQGFDIASSIQDSDIVVIGGVEDVNPNLFGETENLYRLEFDPNEDLSDIQVYIDSIKAGKRIVAIDRGRILVGVLKGYLVIQRLEILFDNRLHLITDEVINYPMMTNKRYIGQIDSSMLPLAIYKQMPARIEYSRGRADSGHNYTCGISEISLDLRSNILLYETYPTDKVVSFYRSILEDYINDTLRTKYGDTDIYKLLSKDKDVTGKSKPTSMNGARMEFDNFRDIYSQSRRTRSGFVTTTSNTVVNDVDVPNFTSYERWSRRIELQSEFSEEDAEAILLEEEEGMDDEAIRYNDHLDILITESPNVNIGLLRSIARARTQANVRANRVEPLIPELGSPPITFTSASAIYQPLNVGSGNSWVYSDDTPLEL